MLLGFQFVRPSSSVRRHMTLRVALQTTPDMVISRNSSARVKFAVVLVVLLLVAVQMQRIGLLASDRVTASQAIRATDAHLPPGDTIAAAGDSGAESRTNDVTDMRHVPEIAAMNSDVFNKTKSANFPDFYVNEINCTKLFAGDSDERLKAKEVQKSMTRSVSTCIYMYVI